MLKLIRAILILASSVFFNDGFAYATAVPRKVAVAGATGRTGSLVVKGLLERGVDGKVYIGI